MNLNQGLAQTNKVAQWRPENVPVSGTTATGMTGTALPEKVAQWPPETAVKVVILYLSNTHLLIDIIFYRENELA
jgi:hypothetical protein